MSSVVNLRANDDLTSGNPYSWGSVICRTSTQAAGFSG